MAQSGGTFELARRTVDAGGGRTAGGGFAATGTIGQPDAALLQGGTFRLQSGFHRRASGSASVDVVFANGFE